MIPGKSLVTASNSDRVLRARALIGGGMTISSPPGLLKRQAKRLTAIAILAGAVLAFHLANVPAVADFAQVKFPYAFSRHALPEVPGPERRSFRPMHPDFHHITAFTSTLWPRAALADIDGQLLPNDVCYVDTETDQKLVTPAPRTRVLYTPLSLHTS